MIHGQFRFGNGQDRAARASDTIVAMKASTIRVLAQCALLAFVMFALSPAAAVAEPIKLKLAFLSSDQSTSYLTAVKPFVDAVNRDGRGLIEIEVYFSGALGKELAEQPRLLLDGKADITYVNPDFTGGMFPDDAVMQLLGIFKSLSEASITYTRLASSGALAGYDNFYVIGAVVSYPTIINSRPPIASIGDLKGKRIRMTSAIEGDLLLALGMVPMQVQVNQIALAISDGSLDAASAAPPPLFEFGISRVTRYHYFAPLGAQTLTLLMSRKSFEGLPAEAQAIIRKYSGDWMAKRHIEIYGADSSDKLERLKADPLRKVVYPSASENDTIDAAAKSVTDTWLAQEPRHRVLFDKMQAELAKVRSGN